MTPKWVLQRMEEYEGYAASEITELKELKATDLDKNQGRLSLPKHVDRRFLNDVELGTLAAGPKKGVSCLFIDTQRKVYNIELREWKTGLVITKGWSNVIDTAFLKIREKYPLWCFRSRNNNDKLCFTLVKDDKLGGPNDTEEEVANTNDIESSSFSHPPDSHDGDSSRPDEDMDLSDDDWYFPTKAECKRFAEDLAALSRDGSA